ncbi:MAG: hypothetical protein IKR25_03810 [Muribaculaceae bacterium]|nr:hypothetical protein [Muribaculaceae bacterium]
MPKTISWKKGMRLSDEIFRTADAFTAAHIGQALLLGSAGRFGLFPGQSPFQVSLSLSADFVEVESLDCLGLTRAGHLIDTHWDTRYTSNFDTRVPLPRDGVQQQYLLIIMTPDGELRETGDGYCEPAYTLALMRCDSTLPDNALPLARLVYNYAWQIDDIDFVPPCLFVSSHKAYEDLLTQFINQLIMLDKAATAHINSAAKQVIRLILPAVRSLRIAADKQRDTLTPMALLGMVQQCVSAFVTGCEVDDNITLDELSEWKNYIAAPYSEHHVHQLIKQGLAVCATIVDKINGLSVATATAPPPPAPPVSRPTPPPAPPAAKTRIITV